MKFRCERDRLAEALGTAGPAVANPGGALPVLSGVHLELSGGSLVITGSDLDLTISVTVGVDGSEDGVVVLPARARKTLSTLKKQHPVKSEAVVALLVLGKRLPRLKPQLPAKSEAVVALRVL